MKNSDPFCESTRGEKGGTGPLALPKDTNMPRGRRLFSEDSLNTFSGAIPHHVRVYPLKTSAGAVVPDAYVEATEELAAPQAPVGASAPAAAAEMSPLPPGR